MKTRYPLIEALEDRIAPAGVVTALLVAGNLTLNGDEAANALTVSETVPGTFTISGTSGTMIKLGAGAPAASLVLPDFNGSVSVNLLAGDDSMTATSILLPKNLAVNFGEGVNSLTVTDSIIAGNVLLVGGTGNDSITFAGANDQIGGALTAKLGNGTNGINLLATNNIQIGGIFSYTGGIDADLVTAATARMDFGGSVVINGGDGSNNVAFNATKSLNVQGNVVITNPDHLNSTDSITLSGDRFTVANSIVITNGLGLNSTNISAGGTGILTVGGSIIVKNGNVTEPNMTVTGISGGSFLSVGGNLTIQNGTGGFSNAIQATNGIAIHNLLSITNGNRSTAAAVDQVISSHIQVGGAATLKSGLGSATTILQASSDLTIGGPLTIIHGDHTGGSSAISVAGTESIVLRGATTLRHGAGTNTTTFNGANAFVGGNLVISGGEGTDTVNLTSTQLGVKGSLIANTGGGNSTVTLTTTHLHVIAALSTLGSSGNDSVNLTGSGRIGGNLTIDLGTGPSDNASIFAATLLNLTVNGSVVVKANTDTGGSSNVSIQKLIATSLNLIGGDGANVFTIANSNIRGAFNLTSLGGADSVLIDNLRVLGLTNVATGTGNDSVSIETGILTGPTTFVQSVVINLGDNEDSLTIGGGTADKQAVFKSLAKFDGSTGTNTLSSTGNVFDLSGQPVTVNFS